MEIQRELLHKYFRGETTPEEEAQIIDWAESSPENYNRYLEERKKWNVLLLHYRQKHVKKTYPINLHRFIQYAAILAVILSVSIYVWNSEKNSSDISISEIQEPTLILGNKEKIALTQHSFNIDRENTQIKNDNQKNLLSYQQQNNQEKNKTHHLLIPHGQTYQIKLSDGTIVILNAESELIYPSQFDTDQRNVTLKGEGYFQVSKDEKRPFIVHTEQVNIQVLGTTFNLSSYTSDPFVRTTLVEGSIKVEQDGREEIIRPSEQYCYNKQTQQSTVETVDTEIYTSWINNEYIFRSATLEEIFAQLAHWYKLDTQYEADILKESRFSFKASRNQTLDQIIRLINNTEQVFIERTNNTIYIKNMTDHE